MSIGSNLAIFNWNQTVHHALVNRISEKDIIGKASG